jgi:HPt (histidine-containing phosphotransfer) domain-containing protein
MEKIIVQVDPDLEDLIPGYLQNRRQDMEAILQALEKQDFETIRILGHTMKGTGGGYGFDAISEMGRALEEAAKTRDTQAIKRELASLLDYLEAVEVVFP